MNSQDQKSPILQKMSTKMYLMACLFSFSFAYLVTNSQASFFQSVPRFNYGALPPVSIYLLALGHFLTAFIYFLFVSKRNRLIEKLLIVALALCVSSLIYFIPNHLVDFIYLAVALRVFISLSHVFKDELSQFCDLKEMCGLKAENILMLALGFGLLLQILFIVFKWPNKDVFVSIWLMGFILCSGWFLLKVKSCEDRFRFCFSLSFLCVGVLFIKDMNALIFIGLLFFLHHIFIWNIFAFNRFSQKKENAIWMERPMGFVFFVLFFHLVLFLGFDVALKSQWIYQVSQFGASKWSQVYFSQGAGVYWAWIFDQRLYSFWLIFHAVTSVKFSRQSSIFQHFQREKPLQSVGLSRVENH